MTGDKHMQDYLVALTEAIQTEADDDALADLLAAYDDIPPEEAAFFTDFIQQLDASLVEVEPAADFSSRLKAELVGSQHYEFIWRIRKLPPRVHIAAFLTLMGGMVLFWRRRLLPDPQDIDIVEEATA